MPNGSIPTLVNYVSTSYGRNGQTDFSVNIPNSNFGVSGAPVGNCIIALVQGGTEAASYTMSDNKGNTWTTLQGVVNLNGQNFTARAIFNCISGTKNIKCTPNVVDSQMQMHVLQFYNVALASALDGTSNAASAAPNPAAGAIVTTADGDLVLWFWGDTTVANPGLANSFIAGNGGTLLCNNIQEAVGLAYVIQNARGSINPTFTSSGTDVFGIIGVALKAADAGTAPDMPYRVGAILHNQFFGSAFTSCKTGLPVLRGDCLASVNNTFNPAGTSFPSSVSDSPGNKWVQVPHSPELNSPSGGTPSIWVADNVMHDPGTITFAMNAATSNLFGQHFILYDMIGVKFDVSSSAVADGLQQVNGNLTTAIIQPGRAPGIVVGVCGIDAHTLNGLVGFGLEADMVGNTGADGSDGTANSDNGWAHGEYTDSNNIQFVWTSQPPGNTGVQFWAAIAAMFQVIADEATNGPGLVTGSPYSFTGEAATGAPELVPGFTGENGPGFVTGSPYSFTGESKTGAPEFVPGAALGPGFVTGAAAAFTGEMATGASDAAGGTPVSKTISVNFESLAGISQARTFNFESLLSVAITRTLVVEALITALQARSANVEALAGATQARSLNEEALAAATQARSINEEALAGVTGSKALSFEALITPLQARSANVEALTGVRQARSINEEALTGVTSGKTFSFEALRSLATVAGINFEALLTVAQARAQNFEALIGVTQARSVNIEALGAAVVSATAVIPFEALTAARQARALNVEALTPAARSASINVESLISVARTAQGNIEALASVSIQRAERFEALAGVAGTVTLQEEALRAIARAAQIPFEAMQGAETRIVVNVVERIAYFKITLTAEARFALERTLTTYF